MEFEQGYIGRADPLPFIGDQTDKRIERDFTLNVRPRSDPFLSSGLVKDCIEELKFPSEQRATERIMLFGYQSEMANLD